MCGINSSSDISQLYECMREKTFSKEEIIFDVGFFPERKVDVEWNNLVQNLNFGTCQTTVIKEKIDNPQNYFVLNLNSSLNYKIFLHDPKVFLMSVNSKAYYRTEIHLSATKSSNQLIEATKYKMLNREEAPCEEDDSYNFTDCLERNMAKRVGCKVILSLSINACSC